MALLEDHLAKFHKMTDAKDMWDAIKSRFGGNDESKKMQKYILKQQFEGFFISNSEGLHKGYDRFQSLLSQLEIHGACVSTKDANQKFLRSLPSSWSQVSLVMRTKPRVDSLSIDDLYNNLRVFESGIKGSTGSSSSVQNVAFVSFESTSSTNDVSTAYGVSTSSGYNSQRENSSSYTDELMYSFFSNQSSGLHLDHEDLEQLDEFDLEEIDLKWQVAMISMRLKNFYKKTGRKLHFDAKEPTDHVEDEQENFALMAYNNSGSDTEYRNSSLYSSFKKGRGSIRKEFAQDTKDLLLQARAIRATSTNTVNTASTLVSTDSPSNAFSTVADFTNLESTVNVSPIPTSRIHSINPTTQILRDLKSAVQTRSKISEALEDESWVDAMQEELFQFKIQKVWILVDLPYRKKLIGNKWVYRNKKDERGVVVRNKARNEAIRIFLAFSSYMGFIVYQMDVKSAFLYGKIDKEVYVSQPLGFVDPKFPKKSRYRGGTFDKTLLIKKDKNDIILQVKQKEDGIFISQDKYVAEILKKFDFASVKTASTPIETQKSLTKDEEAADVDVHLYRSMIGSLMYLIASRADIMFEVCDCSRFQCKKQTIVATSTTKAEYVAAANCCGQSEENTEFHLIVDFLSTCSINYALTVSPTIYASYIEQFWNTTTSKIVNSVKQIHAIVNDRAVVISESSVRNDLLFDDEDGKVNSKPTRAKQPSPAKQPKPVKKKPSKPTSSRKIRKGKRSDHLVDEEDEEP
ncbi:ribonuclease H-like domain-containing protein [Tanacetum coccineum]